METTEDILASLQAILDAADGRSLTDDEAARYEALESGLQAAQRTAQIRARNTAYNMPAPGQHLTYAGAPARVDDTLDRAFEAYLRTGQPNADISGLAVRNDQGVGTSAGGGYTVPPGFRQRLVEVMKAYGGLAAEVDSFSTGNGAPVEYPSLDDTANTGDITAEGGTPSAGNDLSFGSVQLGSYTYTSVGASGNPLRVSWELLQDSAFDIAGLVARALGTRIARKQAAHWCTGTGVGQPFGLVNSTLTADNDVDVADTIDYDDIMDTYDALDPAYEQNATWVFKKNTWSQIRGIVDGNGRPLIQDALSGIGGTPTLNLLGFPVVLDQQMPTFSSAGITLFAAFGDLREAYVIRRVSDLAVIVNPWTRANQRETEFTAWQRADGNVQNRSAYVILRNNT
jgi:HK97 family phage major capsid protein